MKRDHKRSGMDMSTCFDSLLMLRRGCVPYGF